MEKDNLNESSVAANLSNKGADGEQELARKVLETEAAAILGLIKGLDGQFR